MPQLTSCIGKSKKVFTPKAPIRRPGAPPSSQGSVRGSVERQIRTDTQTPQPQPRVVKNTATPALSNSIESPSFLLAPQQQSTPVTHAGNTAAHVPETSIQLGDTQTDTGSQNSYAPYLAISRATREEEASFHVAKRFHNDAVHIQTPRSRELLLHPIPPHNLAPVRGLKRKADLQDLNPQVHKPNRTVLDSSPPPIQPVFTTNETTQTRSVAIPQPSAKRPRLDPASDEESESNVVFTANLRPTTDADAESSGIPTDDAEAESSQLPPRRIPLSAKARGKQRIEDITDAIIADATSGGRKRKKPATRTKRTKEGSGEGERRRKKRDHTPEDAETREIDEDVLRMVDICDDTHIGKKSVRQGEIEAFELAEAMKKREKEREAQARAEAKEVAPEGTEQTAPEGADGDVPGDRNESPEASQAYHAQPETRIVNGEIVIVQSSLTLNRHAMAEAARDAEPEEVVEENDLTRRINAGSYMKREKRQKWGEALTDRFYDGLRMFGTDFEMISRLFVGRSRRLIKLKFTREERYEPQRIKETLLGERIPVNMEELSKMTNTVYTDPQELEREMEEDRKYLEDEQAKEKEAMDEEVRRREEEAAAENAAVDGEVIMNENEDQGRQDNEVHTSQPKPCKKTGKTGKKGKKAGIKKKKQKKKPDKLAPRSKAKSAKELAQALNNIENLGQDAISFS